MANAFASFLLKLGRRIPYIARGHVEKSCVVLMVSRSQGWHVTKYTMFNRLGSFFIFRKGKIFPSVTWFPQACKDLGLQGYVTTAFRPLFNPCLREAK